MLTILKGLQNNMTSDYKSTRMPAGNTGFASGGVTIKLEAFCFYSNSVRVDSFVLRNPPERKARSRCVPLKNERTADINTYVFNI